MAMRISTRCELDKLRELMRHLLVGVRCFFCGRKLLTRSMLVGHEPGSGRGRPLVLDITEHHINGNHDDNRMKNRALAHGTCHRRHHMQERQAARAAARR